MTVLRDALREWGERLRAAESCEPEVEARLIACHLLDLDLGQLPARLDAALSDDARARADRILAARAARVPLPYVLGEAYFYGLRLRCDRRALVPRPETELLVDVALEWLRGRGPATIVDIGTGSGCVALALAAQQPAARIVATDASSRALELARANAEALGYADRIRFLRGDLLAPVRQAGLVSAVRGLVANLPYVSEAEYLTGQPELQHEPRRALVAGPTGLEAVARLIEQLPTLANLEFVGLEISATQGSAPVRMLEFSLPWWRAELRQDLAGLDRVAVAFRVHRESDQR